MNEYADGYHWVQFPQGRARFAGGVRGWDELGHEVFALELCGNEYFGEIKRSYLDNHNDYNIVIDAFGYGRGQDVGMGMPGGTGVRDVFTPEEETSARALVVQLVQAGLTFEDPPFVLDQTDISHFMGKIIFQDGWMLVGSDRAGAA